MTAHLNPLKAVPLFQGFSDGDLEQLARRVANRRVPASATIFRLGDPGDSMFVIAQGVVEIVLPPNESGERTVLQRLGPGDFFGEMALLDHQPRMASAEAVADTELIELSRDSLFAQLQQSPQLVPAMLRVMSARLRIAAQLLGTTTTRNINREADQRLTWSQRLADTVARWNGSWGFIAVLVLLSAGWFAVNSLSGPVFDPYPYQLFNLLVAILIAMQGPLIMMSQNRQALKERLHTEADYVVNLKNETGIHRILHELGELRNEVVALRRELRSGAPDAPSSGTDPAYGVGAQKQ